MSTPRVFGMVLAGGEGKRLMPLTADRAKPAVPFGGSYRLIDFALSNLINSGLRRIVVLTQYKSHSLLRHLQRGWSFLRAELNEMVDLLPAQQRLDEEHWYRGTADAIYQNIDIIESNGPKYIVILAGDHIYKMDYTCMFYEHVERGAGDLAGIQRGFQISLDDQSAAGAVDDADALFHFGDGGRVDVSRLVGTGRRRMASARDEDRRRSRDHSLHRGAHEVRQLL